MSVQEQIEAIDAQIPFWQWILDKRDTGNYWLVEVGGALVPIAKDDIAAMVAKLVAMGIIDPGEVTGCIDELKRASDQGYELIRQRLASLRQKRQWLASGQPATPTVPTTPTAPPTTGQPAGRGFWQLKEGYPRITNANPSNNAFEAVESAVSTSSLTYHYTKRKYSGEVEHDFTVHASFAGIDRAVREANEEFTFTLEGSFARAKDSGIFDGKCPYLERDGVTVVTVDPLPAGKRIDEAAQMWLGRFTDGKDFPADRRSITVRMPEGGADCYYGVSIDPNHKVIWAYTWIQ